MLRSLVLAAIVGVATHSAAIAQSCQPEAVFVRNGESVVRFSIELAVTPEERSRGLMFRESMPRQSGMLFVYERPQPAAFWMKNTLIPLDMIFVDKRGVVTHVHGNAIPGDLTPIDGGNGVLSVLEINGGLAARYGIRPGAELRHEVFSSGPASWPC